MLLHHFSNAVCSAHKAFIRETKPTADAALAPHKVKMWCPGFVVHGDVAGLARRPVDWVGFQTKVNATKSEAAWFTKRVKDNRWWEESRAQKPLPARRATSSSSHSVVPTPSSSDIPPPTYNFNVTRAASSPFAPSAAIPDLPPPVVAPSTAPNRMRSSAAEPAQFSSSSAVPTPAAPVASNPATTAQAASKKKRPAQDADASQPSKRKKSTTSPKSLVPKFHVNRTVLCTDEYRLWRQGYPTRPHWGEPKRPAPDPDTTLGICRRQCPPCRKADWPCELFVNQKGVLNEMCLNCFRRKEKTGKCHSFGEFQLNPSAPSGTLDALQTLADFLDERHRRTVKTSPATIPEDSDDLMEAIPGSPSATDYPPQTPAADATDEDDEAEDESHAGVADAMDTDARPRPVVSSLFHCGSYAPSDNPDSLQDKGKQRAVVPEFDQVDSATSWASSSTTQAPTTQASTTQAGTSRPEPNRSLAPSRDVTPTRAATMERVTDILPDSAAKTVLALLAPEVRSVRAGTVEVSTQLAAFYNAIQDPSSLPTAVRELRSELQQTNIKAQFATLNSNVVSLTAAIEANTRSLDAHTKAIECYAKDAGSWSKVGRELVDAANDTLAFIGHPGQITPPTLSDVFNTSAGPSSAPSASTSERTPRAARRVDLTEDDDAVMLSDD